MRSIWLWSLMVAAPALCQGSVPGQGLATVPDRVSVVFLPNPLPFDTVFLVNRSQGSLRVDSITVRFLDGGVNPRPQDFTACKTCPADSLMRYNYEGWMYGFPDFRPLKYLRDSLFLILDGSGAPSTFDIGPGDSLPFALHIPVNCPLCGRMPSYPGADNYAITFISSGGGRATLAIQVDRPTGISRMSTSLRNPRARTASLAVPGRGPVRVRVIPGPEIGARPEVYDLKGARMPDWRERE